MSWKFEHAIPMIGSIIEGPAWDGRHLYFTNIALDRVLKYDPGNKTVAISRENANGANGLNGGAGGRLFACEGRGRRIARYDPDGSAAMNAGGAGQTRLTDNPADDFTPAWSLAP